MAVASSVGLPSYLDGTIIKIKTRPQKLLLRSLSCEINKYSIEQNCNNLPYLDVKVSNATSMQVHQGFQDLADICSYVLFSNDG